MVCRMREFVEVERGRVRGTPLVCLLSLLIAGCAAIPPPRLGPHARVQVKRGGEEVIILAKERTHYFENGLPHCLAYVLTGEWEFGAQDAALRTPDRRRFVGVVLRASETIPGSSSADAVSRAVAYFQADTEKDWGGPIPSTAEPFPVSRAGAVLLQFGEVVVTPEAAARVLGPEKPKVGQTARLPKRVIVPFLPGLIMVVTVTDVADAREVLDTLEATEHPRCWEPTIRERFPGVLR